VENFLAGAAGAYGLILVDPPFAEGGEWRAGGGEGEALRSLAGILAIGGTLILRLDASVAAPEWPGLDPEGERTYGRSRVCRYLKK
jgi:hypothetical protein